jgi:hypothetical protein
MLKPPGTRCVLLHLPLPLQFADEWFQLTFAILAVLRHISYARTHSSAIARLQPALHISMQLKGTLLHPFPRARVSDEGLSVLFFNLNSAQAYIICTHAFVCDCPAATSPPHFHVIMNALVAPVTQNPASDEGSPCPPGCWEQCSGLF